MEKIINYVQSQLDQVNEQNLNLQTVINDQKDNFQTEKLKLE